MECSVTCHEVCTLGDNDTKKSCRAIRTWISPIGYCTVCPGKCHWEKHKNARFIIVPKETVKLELPEDLIRLWNKNTNTLEGATLDAMKEYLKLQDELVDKIKTLMELTKQLKNEALKHNPEALLHYLDLLVKDGKARGLSASELEALIKARKVIQIELKIESGDICSDISVVEILHKVKKELERRNKLDAKAREKEESANCNFYNDLRKTLPKKIRETAPPVITASRPTSLRLQKFGKFLGSACTLPYVDGTFPTENAMEAEEDFYEPTLSEDVQAQEEIVPFKENLKAIVQLLKILLSKGIFEGQEFTF